MFPTVKPIKFTYEIEHILKSFSAEINSQEIKTQFIRLHKDNIFNRRFSGVLDSFSDIKTVSERLTENIQASMIIEGKLQEQVEINQELHHKANKLTSQNQTDLKNLYINTKIFLDEYTSLICWIIGWRGIQNSSITKFYKSLNEYDGADSSIILFKKYCLQDIKQIDEYITTYRDKDVVHVGDKHNQTTKWFLNEMNGVIKFIGGNRESITPQEVLFLTVEYVDSSAKFCIDWLSSKLSSEVKM